MNSEDDTHKQLAVGHLLKRREELSDMLAGKSITTPELNTLMEELINVNIRLIEHHRMTNYE